MCGQLMPIMLNHMTLLRVIQKSSTMCPSGNVVRTLEFFPPSFRSFQKVFHLILKEPAGIPSLQLESPEKSQNLLKHLINFVIA